VYWGEVGPDASADDSTRGPKGYDEVNQAKKAGYFGYPLFIADHKPYRAYDYETGVSGDFFDPEKPINNSRNNTGLQQLPPATKAMIYYPYGESAEFPAVGSGGRNAMAGPVFYADLYPKETRFPDYYNGKLFIYDWIRNWIFAVSFDDKGDFKRMERFMPSMTMANAIDMEMGPDGRMYILEYGRGWFSRNADAGLYRIDYNGGNRAPVASFEFKAQSQHPTGIAPLNVTADASASYDPDKDAVKYRWIFGDGTEQTTDEATVSYTYKTNGEYLMELEVIDSKGLATKSASKSVTVGNERPLVQIRVQGNQSFYFQNKPIVYQVSVKDAEDGSLEAGSIAAEQVFVQANYVKGEDQAAIAQGHQIITGVTAGKAIVSGSDCLTCHKTNEKSIGPSFTDIAAKYPNNDKNTQYLAEKIIKGGSGVWGEVAMAAHPTISQQEASQIASYIFSFAADAKLPKSLPLKGNLQAGLGKPITEDGVLHISATYSDKGATNVKSITETHSISLRYPRLLAHRYEKVDKASSVEFEGMKFVIPSHEATIQYRKIDFTNVASLELIYFVLQTPQTGYIVSVHLDSPSGTKVGEVVMGPGALPKQPNVAKVNLAPVTDGQFHELVLVFTAQDPANPPTAALQRLQFTSK
jgi:cytochrome c